MLGLGGVPRGGREELKTMADKIDQDGTALLVESEVRFREALGRLAKALVGARDMKSQIKRLQAEKTVLEGGLSGLKTDYEMLEKSFQGVKAKLDKGSGNQGEQSEEDRQDVEALQKELSMMRSDYDAMEQSYSLLKTQFLDSQKKETASDKRSARQLRTGLTEQLDGTIARLEGMLIEADAR